MTDTYDSKRIADAYDSARSLPAETIALWVSKLKESVPPGGISRVLDLGGGTGRFAPALRTACAGQVIVIDPSAAMLKSGWALRGSEIEWACGMAENLPLSDGSIDLVWMSQAFHHLDNKPAAFQEINRVLAGSGRLVVRNGTQESDAELEWTSCFPEAQELGKKKIPFRSELIESVGQYGFCLQGNTTVYQMFARSYSEHYEKISRRGLSGLIEISDEAFAAGLERLRRWVETKPEDQPVLEPVDMFVFQKVP